MGQQAAPPDKRRRRTNERTKKRKANSLPIHPISLSFPFLSWGLFSLAGFCPVFCFLILLFLLYSDDGIAYVRSLGQCGCYGPVQPFCIENQETTSVCRLSSKNCYSIRHNRLSFRRHRRHLCCFLLRGGPPRPEGYLDEHPRHWRILGTEYPS
ncbi:hypothetical protein I7I50_08420 [Histoplasma capsulatum G186AR]|uniref:Uncharacterized protein n=1 Tax=Ajellomyces capsulatus TaxID=5037 RepID=A0A8H7YQU5_AJECA|nr:hypothetical protein I7I52_05936 [Histoplasma capsulatum]QSS73592.1 hypothetical protein I7I50_08420 [Histoplasma capsulatum G186AR]